MNVPIVSIIVPVYNRAVLVREAIDSALAAAVPLEVVVVDDASTDDTWDSLRALNDPRLRIARLERNSGQCAARNRGIEIATGRYIKFLDSDDLLLPEHLPAEVQAMESGADIAVSGWYDEDENGKQVVVEAPRFKAIVDDVLAGHAVTTSGAMYARRAAVRWDPALRKVDDWDYFCQSALGASRIDTVPGEAYIIRQHGGVRATDAGSLANAREFYYILHKVERRLAAEGRLTQAHKERLAQYYYKELRVLCLQDGAAFEAEAAHIRELDPRFQPRDEERQWYVRGLACAVGFRQTIRLHSAMKRAWRRLRG